MLNLDPAWIALIGTLCGGLGLKLLEHWLGKNKEKIDVATKLRDELRGQLNDQRDELRGLEAEVDKWKMEYFDLRDKYSELNSNYLIALEKLRSEMEESINKSEQAIEPQ